MDDSETTPTTNEETVGCYLSLDQAKQLSQQVRQVIPVGVWGAEVKISVSGQLHVPVKGILATQLTCICFM